MYRDSWVYCDSRVYRDSGVYLESRLYLKSRVYLDSRVYHDSRIYLDSRVYCDSGVYLDSRVYLESPTFCSTLACSQYLTVGVSGLPLLCTAAVGCSSGSQPLQQSLAHSMPLEGVQCTGVDAMICFGESPTRPGALGCAS